MTRRLRWALALSAFTTAACDSDPNAPGRGAGGAGASDPVGGEGGGGATGGGGGAPWTSGTAKYAPVWEAQISCTGTVGSRVGDVFVHGGDVFLAGTLDGNCSVFGGDATAADGEAVIAARLAGADGATVWTRADVVDGLFGFGAAGFGADGLVIHGGFDQAFQPEGGSLLEPVTFTDHSPAYTTFLMTVDADGGVTSSRAIKVEQVGAHFDVEPQGAIAVVAGSYVADFGSGPYTAELSKNPIAQLDAAGDEVWSDIVGADFPALFFAHEVAINPERSTLLTASLLGLMTFAGDALETSDKSSPVMALFDDLGEPVRALALQASEEGCVLHPFALSDGSFVVSATCSGTLAIGAEVVGTPDAPLAVIVQLSSSGDVAWARTFQGPIDRFHVAGSPSGLILAGSFHDTIDLGDGPLASAGRTDIFLAGLDASGATLWSQRMGDEWDNTIEGLTELDGDLIVSSISSLDPDAAPAGDGFVLLNVARLHP